MMLARAAWLGGAVLAAGLAARADDGTLFARVLPSLARHELEALDRLAGLRAADGKPRDADGLPIALDGDDTATSIVREAVADDGVWRLAEGPHRLVVEPVALARACALRLSLERRGWILHTAQPTRRRLLPALALVPALLGLAVWARWRRRLAAVLVAAATAQTALALWPWPAELPPGRWLDDLAAGPLVAPVVALARGLEELGTALAVGVITLCLLLAWFDHRSSRARGAGLVGAGMLAVFGGLALLEAATRASWSAWCLTLVGALASALVLVLALTCSRVWHDIAPTREPPR